MKFLPVDKYIERIQVYNADQDRLKAELFQIFSANERGEELLEKFKALISDELLVSQEIFTNPDIYRCLREALESRSIHVPELVTDTQSRSFVVKRIIAAVWSTPDEKVLRASLLLEYHNMRKEVVNANKSFFGAAFHTISVTRSQRPFLQSVATSRDISGTSTITENLRSSRVSHRNARRGRSRGVWGP